VAASSTVAIRRTGSQTVAMDSRVNAHPRRQPNGRPTASNWLAPDGAATAGGSVCRSVAAAVSTLPNHLQ
jgi:hypothetical protein